jgi:hypothetical protein
MSPALSFALSVQNIAVILAFLETLRYNVGNKGEIMDTDDLSLMAEIKERFGSLSHSAQLQVIKDLELCLLKQDGIELQFGQVGASVRNHPAILKYNHEPP